MIKPEEIWVAWAVDQRDGQIDLIGSVPADTPADELDVHEQYKHMYHPYDLHTPKPAWELHTGTLDEFLSEWLSRELRGIKLKLTTRY